MFQTPGSRIGGGQYGLKESTWIQRAMRWTPTQRAQARSNINAVLKGQIFGLTLSMAGGSATFTIASGEAANSTGVDLMVLASIYTKTTSAWAVGTAAGSLDTGSIAANNWYHVFLIKRVDTGVVDILTSLSATAPTIPTNYTLSRRIGSMRTDASSFWTLIHQIGDEFLWDSTRSGSVTNPGTSSALYVVGTPVGVQTWAILGVIIQVIGTTDARGWIISPDMPDQGVVSSSNMNFGGIQTVNTGTTDWICQAIVRTDTSAQVRARLLASDANSFFGLTTMGWIDRRGKDS